MKELALGMSARSRTNELSFALVTFAVVIFLGIIGLGVVVTHRQKRKRQLKDLLRAKNLGPILESREIAQNTGKFIFLFCLFVSFVRRVKVLWPSSMPTWGLYLCPSRPRSFRTTKNYPKPSILRLFSRIPTGEIRWTWNWRRFLQNMPKKQIQINFQSCKKSALIQRIGL